MRLYLPLVTQIVRSGGALLESGRIGVVRLRCSDVTAAPLELLPDYAEERGFGQ